MLGGAGNQEVDMDTIYKILENCEVKKLGERQYEFIASTADIDRDGEVIDVNGWDLKNFKKNPVIMYAHDYRTLPIGKATKIGVSDGKLKNTVEFPPEGTYEFADIVERLVNTGYLKTESVGFIPRKWEDGDGEKNSPSRTYTKQELLEISIVPVPSNPNALRDAVEQGVITTKQLETITKPEEIVPQKKEISQGEIKDELDYVSGIIDKGDLNEDNKKLLKELVEKIKRVPGCDNPVNNTIKVEIKDLPEVMETLNQANKIIDDDKIKNIIENSVRKATK